MKYPYNLSEAVSLPASFYMRDFEERRVFETSFPDLVFYLSAYVGTGDELFVSLHLAGSRYYPLRVNMLLQLVDDSSTGNNHVRQFDDLLFWRDDGESESIETGFVSFLDRVDWRFVNKNAIHFRVLSLELDSNKRPPFNFAMCGYENRQQYGTQISSRLLHMGMYFTSSCLGAV